MKMDLRKFITIQNLTKAIIIFGLLVIIFNMIVERPFPTFLFWPMLGMNLLFLDFMLDFFVFSE